MKGSYHFVVKSKKMLFDFKIRRNITVIKGDSATGKTTLLHMMYEYLRTGRESGYFVSADVINASPNRQAPVIWKKRLALPSSLPAP